MQHPDEGTIHSWLDGALSADEAARVEAHVDECSECAAAVAEARGFIAASSRILTALDNAPRGVIPAAAPRKRFDPMVWRIAATLLVVAGGTLVVLRNGSKGELARSVSADTALSPTATSTTAAEAAGTTAQVAPAAPSGGDASTASAGTARGGVSGRGTTATSPTSTPIGDGTATTKARGANAADEKGLARVSERRTNQQIAAAENSVAATAPAPPAIAPAQVADLTVVDRAAESDSLKVIGTPRRLGARVTLYEVSPGDTVTLTESIPTQLQSVVTGAAAARAVSQTMGKAVAEGRRDAASAPTSESQRPPAMPTPAPPLPVAQSNARFSTVGAINTISWTDPATGRTLTLSGRVSEARLQAIRIKIERERAAAATRRNP